MIYRLIGGPLDGKGIEAPSEILDYPWSELHFPALIHDPAAFIADETDLDELPVTRLVREAYGPIENEVGELKYLGRL